MPPKSAVWRLVLLAINLASTGLTLLTGLKDNPVVAYASDRYGLIRSRLRNGLINYNLARDDFMDINMLVNLTAAATDFRFITAPRRSLVNLGEDRSTCMRVGSINTTIFSIHYKDFWGTGPRRQQMFVFSISAPRCQVANFRPAWYKACTESYDNATACHRYILDNFDELQDNRVVQVEKEGEFGIPGVPFLKCMGRPERQFNYMTDLMVQQAYWAGGGLSLEVQSSRCLASPMLRNSDMKWGLFKVAAVDTGADTCFGVDSSGWVGSTVSFLYGVVSLVMIGQGIFSALVRSKAVHYLPNHARFVKGQRFLRFLFPSMSLATLLTDDENAIIRFKGALLMASDIWLNHWLYISLSILESLVNVRLTYLIYNTGTWMLRKKANVENFLFVCSALTRMTWLMCFFHTVLRLGTKVVLHSLRTVRMVRPQLRQSIAWYIDASALFLNFKVYNVLLGIYLITFYKLNGSTTLMKQEVPVKRAVLGGLPDITKFWGSEIICDYLIVYSLLTLIGLTVGSLMLCTRYRHVADNRVIRLMQQRYVFVGWDVFVVMQALGIDPMNPKLNDDGVVSTNCSVGCLLQQFYASGPSGLVQLAGDYIFQDGGFSKDPVAFAYPPKKALRMGLVQTRAGSGTSTTRAKYAPTTTLSSARPDESRITSQTIKARVVDQPDAETRRSIYSRQLRIYSEGMLGKILLLDADEQGKFIASSTGLMVFTVHDALTTMPILDIKYLLGNDKKLHIT